MSILTELPTPMYLRQRPVLQTADIEFDLATARAMAWAAQLAYETNDPDKVQRALAAWGWSFRGYHSGSVSSVLPLTSAKGFIAARENVSILTFAGTEPVNLADWIVDFSIHLTNEGVHQGFETGVDVVWDTISASLGAGGPGAADKLFIAGHSLGGALAAVAACRLVEKGVVTLDRLLGVYTFGMPRVGDVAFAQNYRVVGGGGLADRTYRMVDGADLVPSVPPAGEPFAFRHFGCSLTCTHGEIFDRDNLIPDAPEQVPPGQSAFLGLLQSLLRAPPARDLPTFPGDPSAAIVIESLPPSIRDHVMDRYLRALGGL